MTFLGHGKMELPARAGKLAPMQYCSDLRTTI